ncbi:hypothetical protein [Streptomyces europaeiscabiei]|uniref:hypothetical protein n=1 Tax=Streptomyces europaeiscabiei TaxID=146819 RepID=UPI0038F6F823
MVEPVMHQLTAVLDEPLDVPGERRGSGYGVKEQPARQQWRGLGTVRRGHLCANG